MSIDHSQKLKEEFKEGFYQILETELCYLSPDKRLACAELVASLIVSRPLLLIEFMLKDKLMTSEEMAERLRGSDLDKVRAMKEFYRENQILKERATTKYLQ